jgi:hypothetical protein
MKAPHLTISRPVTRANTLRAYQLNEPCPVKYDGTAKSIIDLIEWFNVEKSARYAATKESTFCNIYAHDLANAMGHLGFGRNSLGQAGLNTFTHGWAADQNERDEWLVQKLPSGNKA